VEASPAEGQQLQQKDEKRGKKKRTRMDLDLCTGLSKTVIKFDASGKKGMLSFSKYLLEYIKLI